jgi:tripartite-type tricarboxylate transporter receptor subunit TctC
MWAPKGTPKSIIATLNHALVGALADVKVQQRFRDLGLEAPMPVLQTPEGLGAFQKAEVDKWWPIIKAAHITAE